MKYNKKNIAVLALAVILTLASASVVFAAIPEPSESFYVADYADVITNYTENIIIDKNADLEYYCDGAQIVVVTVDFLDGMNIEDYCYKLFNEWEIGSKSNNGILLLLSIGEDNYWCMTGKGLERDLTAGEIDDLLWYNLEEHFAAGNYDEGVQAVFDLLSKELYNIYNVSVTSDSIDENDSFADDYNDELTTIDWITGILILVVIIVVIVLVSNLISRSSSGRKSTYYYNPTGSSSIRKTSHRNYMPAPHHRPHHKPHHKPYHRPDHRPASFGHGFSGDINSRPSNRPPRPTSRPSRPTSRPSGGIGRGGGGSSRGGGAGRRGR